MNHPLTFGLFLPSQRAIELSHGLDVQMSSSFSSLVERRKSYEALLAPPVARNLTSTEWDNLNVTTK